MDWEQNQFPVDLSEAVLEEIKPMETDQIVIEVATTIMEKPHEEGYFSEY